VFKGDLLFQVYLNTMVSDLILKNVCKHIDLTQGEKEYFLSMLQKQIIKRKQIFLAEGDVCKNSVFVVQGALKGYTIDKEGREHVLQFAMPDWWIADMYSLISQKPGVLNIEALVDTDVLLLPREQQHNLYLSIPKFERFFRILTENSLVASQQRLINNLSLTAEERYADFIVKYPAILECAPQHSIASYLGITPEFLSKIRSRQVKKH
jgi:CRP-like cAMP-binding protein